MSRLYPDRRRAGELTRELAAARQELARMQCDDRASAEDIREQREAIYGMERALFLCGAPKVEA